MFNLEISLQKITKYVGLFIYCTNPSTVQTLNSLHQWNAYVQCHQL